MKNERITSIDALRAVVLLGILLVHTLGLFGFSNGSNTFSYFTSLDTSLREFIDCLLTGRCNVIFSLLFGVSFYLILKNPNYSSLKFAYRCMLLSLLGLVVKCFYTYDALMWYGIMGIFLVLFRHLKPRYLFLSFCLLAFFTVYLKKISIGEFLFNPKEVERYIATNSLFDIIRYPLVDSVVDYLRAAVSGGILKTLSYFVLGYFFAKVGIIENLSKYSSMRNILILLVLYVSLWVYYHKFYGSISYYFYCLFGAFFYAMIFLFFYYKFCTKISFSWLESYGKLGITNYVMQNIYGVIFVSTIFIPYRFQFTSILLCSLLFYVIQMLFSVVWLRYYRYGPLEWCWRTLTNMRAISNRKASL